MGSNRKQIKYKHDITRAMYNVRLRFQRRLQVPMFHPLHINQVADIFITAGKELKRISSLNSLRRVDKLIHAHYQIGSMNFELGNIKPEDPRDRGAEEFRYGHNGFESIQGLEDLDAIITQTEGEEDHASDGDQQARWFAQDRERRKELARRKHNQPPETKSNSEKQTNDKYFKFMHKKGKYAKSSL